MKTLLKIGTRGSQLALTQTNMVAAALTSIHPNVTIEIIVIRTSGDWSPADGETPLPEHAGGKALFAKEIEEALLRGDIDIAVHSMKDMDSVLPDGLSIDHMLARVDSRDALLFHDRDMRDTAIPDLPRGFKVGTTSPRRAAMLLHLNPYLNIVNLRGNVPTRIKKLRAGQVDATLLAAAGLTRLNLTHEIDKILNPTVFTPAAGQGAVGIERRIDDGQTAALLDGISCLNTQICVQTERAVLRGLSGNCKTPVGVHVRYVGDEITLNAALLSLDGKDIHRADDTFKFAERGLDAAALRAHNHGLSLKSRITS